MNAPGRWGAALRIPDSRDTAAHRRTFDRFVIRQIRFGDKPAVILHLSGNLVGNRAFIEGIRPQLGNQLQAFPQLFLHQLIALFFSGSPFFPEDSPAVGMVGITSLP